MPDLSVIFDGVMYSCFQGDPEIILADSHAQIKPLVSLIRANRIRAAIFPPENRQAFNEAAQSVTEGLMQSLPNGTTYMRRTHILDNIEYLTSPDIELSIKNSPFLQQEIQRVSLPVRSAYPYDPFSLMLLSSPSHADKESFAPIFQTYNGSTLVCYTGLKGRGLEFPIGPLTALEEATLNIYAAHYSLKSLNGLPGWEGRFHATEPGDMIVFGPRFHQRTASKSDEENQLAVLSSYNAPSGVMAL